MNRITQFYGNHSSLLKDGGHSLLRAKPSPDLLWPDLSEPMLSSKCSDYGTDCQNHSFANHRICQQVLKTVDQFLGTSGRIRQYYQIYSSTYRFGRISCKKCGPSVQDLDWHCFLTTYETDYYWLFVPYNRSMKRSKTLRVASLQAFSFFVPVFSKDRWLCGHKLINKPNPNRTPKGTV